MPMTEMELKPHLAMRAKGWQYVGVYVSNSAPARLKSHFIANSCEVRETQFDDMGDEVDSGSFALWVNPCAIAVCGCVHSAKEGWPCEHDLAKFEKLKKIILG